MRRRISEIALAIGTVVAIGSAVAVGLLVHLPAAFVERRAWGAEWAARAGVALASGFLANYILNVIVNQAVRGVPASKVALWSFEWPDADVVDAASAARDAHEAAVLVRELAERVAAVEDALTAPPAERA
jgi:hypothetical protein